MALYPPPVPAIRNTQTSYDFRYGELDLLESGLKKEARSFLLILLFLLVGVVVIALAVVSYRNQPPAAEQVEDVVPSPAVMPTISAATVTLGPPTATVTFTPTPTEIPTETPTRGPCVITLPEGQSLIWAVANCGHQSLDVLPTVLALNDIADAASVRSGQEILIPWPTETENPDLMLTPESTSDAESSSGSDAQSILVVDESLDAFAPTEIPTLPAGIMWHEIGPGENIITIADRYNADVKVLSELNREIDFARCDFGLRFGGPECIVQLFQGQLIRVPAPTPTPTLSPTPDPNATVTPTPTATVNQPSVFAPADRAFFYMDQLITLRWVPSATLQQGEVYLVDVQDLTSGRSYSALTRDISFTVPVEWRGVEQTRHEYRWTVGIVTETNPQDVRYETEPRLFVWQGKSEGN